MPWSAPQTDKCPICSKSVYANEARLAAGEKFHAVCFKCESCNKALDSTTVAIHEKNIFCKQCHGKKFGMGGYGFGGGAGCMSTEGEAGTHKVGGPAQAKIGGGKVEGGCPRCGKRVYEAEKKVGAGGNWHKSCFNCKNCHKSLDSSTTTEREGEIYCKGCYAKAFGPHGKI